MPKVTGARDGLFKKRHGQVADAPASTRSERLGEGGVVNARLIVGFVRRLHELSSAMLPRSAPHMPLPSDDQHVRRLRIEAIQAHSIEHRHA